MFVNIKIKARVLYLFFFLILLVRANSIVCAQGVYPPFTKWYQDPLGCRPLQLSSAVGFLWGATAVAASLIFTKNDSSFNKKVYLYSDAGMGFGYKPPYTTQFQADMGLLFDVRKWMAIGVGCNLIHFKDAINNTWAIGFRPFARWYPFTTTGLRLFFEYGAGLSYSFEKFPLTGTGWKADTARVGTHFNFTTKYGIGAEFRINKALILQVGVRHFHLSNGNLAGIERNPSHDSNGFFAGLIYGLRKN